MGPGLCYPAMFYGSRSCMYLEHLEGKVRIADDLDLFHLIFGIL